MDRDEMVRIDDAIKDAIGAGDHDAFESLMAPELAADFRQAIAEIKQAFPDYAGTNERHVVEGDTVVTRWIYHGTHEGEFAGVAPTGRRVEVTGISISRFADGKMVDNLIESNELDVLRQIGATTIPDEEHG